MTADSATISQTRRSPGESGGAPRPPAVLPAAALDRNAALAPAAALARAAGALARRTDGDAAGADALAAAALPEIAAAVGARAAVLIGPPPHFRPGSSWGRDGELPPRETLADCLDRDAARLVPAGDDETCTTMILPGGAPALPIAVLTGRGLNPTDLPGAWAAIRCLAALLPGAGAAENAAGRAARFERLAAAAARLSAVKESGPLLEALASAACDLLDCDRASIFLHVPDPASDRDGGGRTGPGQLVGRPALGVEGGELSIPADAGVVGEVFHSGEPARVADAANDPRVAAAVDDRTGYETRTLLAVPLYPPGSPAGGAPIGVFEAMNKAEGAFTSLDEEILAALAPHAASALANATERDALVRSRDAAAARAADAADGRIRLIGESPAVATLRDTVNRLAATDLPVLVTGESGTGKEVVATCLHDRGPRSNGPFVAVNCAALTESLLESELFGHERGAFTDAREARPGKFELADGGTLFLDEIGDMSPGGQAKLLRVLEQRVVTRVGGSKPIPVDVRVVAATNADLAEKVANKSFRADLYYRLGVVTHHLPPLRERPEDVIPLAEHFLATFAAKAGRPLPRLSAEARKRLQAHAWPGNVRELRNTIERVVYLGNGDTVEPAELTFLLAPGRPGTAGAGGEAKLTEATRDFQREFIAAAVDRVRGNMSEAAKLLGLHRSNLYRKMKQLGMEGD
ncbi:sigma 54-interacting transcriptional regulator [Alienimonas sp. DA493]|uniref:sigma 54-interacting transcriptional regulator n=1 Tax=Alienimonas sp. DA493 TaxID=3373605 RepID=UPI0037553915